MKYTLFSVAAVTATVAANCERELETAKQGQSQVWQQCDKYGKGSENCDKANKNQETSQQVLDKCYQDEKKKPERKQPNCADLTSAADYPQWKKQGCDETVPVTKQPNCADLTTAADQPLRKKYGCDEKKPEPVCDILRRDAKTWESRAEDQCQQFGKGSGNCDKAMESLKNAHQAFDDNKCNGDEKKPESQQPHCAYWRIVVDQLEDFKKNVNVKKGSRQWNSADKQIQETQMELKKYCDEKKPERKQPNCADLMMADDKAEAYRKMFKTGSKQWFDADDALQETQMALKKFGCNEKDDDKKDNQCYKLQGDLQAGKAYTNDVCNPEFIQTEKCELGQLYNSRTLHQMRDHGCDEHADDQNRTMKIVGWTLVPTMAIGVVGAVIAKKIQAFNSNEGIYEAFVDQETA